MDVIGGAGITYLCISMGGVDSSGAVVPRGATIGIRDKESNINRNGTLSRNVARGTC